ncbi:MAG: signal peptide peptidase SppA [Verrucomicrobia bacterium]|nr:signal peptide peptidase SppA [Verrucomicrobiota bacterium]
MESNSPPVYGGTPPLIQPPPAHRRMRAGRGWMVLALVLAAVLGLVGAREFARWLLPPGGLGGSGVAGHSMDEVTIENNRSENKIAVVGLEGIITSQMWDGGGRNMVDLISEQLKMAGRDKSVKAVILKVDSPGGEVMASDDISRAISEFQEKHGKPAVAFLSGLAASGGYYVAVPCQWIVASELTITGSIGVIMHSFNYRGLLDKVGLHPQVFKSGKFKDMLSGSRKLDEVDPKEGEMIQSMIDETYSRFKKVVETGRRSAQDKNKGNGRALVENWQQYADGRVLTGLQAYDYGFVDETGNFETAVKRAKNIAQIDGANLVRYVEPFSLARVFGFLGKKESTALKLDLGLEFPKLQAGRLYFLSSTVLH